MEDIWTFEETIRRDRNRSIKVQLVTDDDDDVDEVWYGLEMNVENTDVMGISRQTFPVQITMNQKDQENVEFFKCLGSIITNYAKCTQDIRCMIVVAIAAFKKNRNFHQQIRLKFREGTSELLHVERSFVWY